MTNQQKQALEQNLRLVWTATKNAIAPEHHPRLRKMLMRIIRQDEKEYQEFVELMETSEDDVANKKLQEAAHEDESETSLHKCHYCGDMYHLSDLEACKDGLVCYRCRMELENRE